MRFPVPLIVDVPDDQLAQWAEATGVPQAGGQVRAKDAVDGLRAQVLEAVGAWFGGLGVRADVSVKR